MKKYLLALIVLAVAIPSVRYIIKAREPADFSELIQSSSFYDLTDIFIENKSRKWPHIGWGQESESMAKYYEQAAILFLHKAGAAEIPDWEDDLPNADLVKKLALYQSWRELLMESGGCTNLILADSFDRLSLAILAHNLLLPNAKMEELTPLSKSICSKRIEAKYILKPLVDELKYFQLNMLDPGNLDTSLKVMENSLIPKSNLISMRYDTFATQCIREHDEIILLHRLLRSDQMRVSLIPGYIEFRKRGGTDADAASREETGFNKVMGDTLPNFTYPLLHQETYSTYEVYDFIQDFRDPIHPYPDGPFYLLDAFEDLASPLYRGHFNQNKMIIHSNGG